MERRDRYQLLTSLIVPRPIGWVSTRSAEGLLNLAPFSYFAALAATPMLVGVSIGSRRGSPKDSYTNILDRGAFCINVVTERHLEAMNETSAEHPPEIDEFEVAGLTAVDSEVVDAPWVAECPAVLECRLYRDIDLEASGTHFVIGEVVRVRLSPDLRFLEGTFLVDPESLRPIGRLGGSMYSLPGTVREIPRPQV